MTVYSKTIFKLTSGCAIAPARVRYFDTTQYAVAAQRFAEQVVALTNNDKVGAAYVTLSRLPDRLYPEGLDLLGWTKMDDAESLPDGVEDLDTLLQ